MSYKNNLDRDDMSGGIPTKTAKRSKETAKNYYELGRQSAMLDKKREEVKTMTDMNLVQQLKMVNDATDFAKIKAKLEVMMFELNLKMNAINNKMNNQGVPPPQLPIDMGGQGMPPQLPTDMGGQGMPPQLPIDMGGQGMPPQLPTDMRGQGMPPLMPVDPAMAGVPQGMG